MGNYKFRLSEMIPNAWFYKLKDLGKGRDSGDGGDANSLKKIRKKRPKGKVSIAAAQLPSSPKKMMNGLHNSSPRKSYYFSREFQSTKGDSRVSYVDLQKKMLEQRMRKLSSPRSLKVVSPPAGADCNCQDTVGKSDDFPVERSALCTLDGNGTIIVEEDNVPLQQLFPLVFRADRFLETQVLDHLTSKSSGASSSGDIIIGVDSQSLNCSKPACEGNPDGDVYLPPIVTKRVSHLRKEKGEGRKKDRHCSGDGNGDDQNKITTSVSPGTRRYYQSSGNSPGIKLRTNSPRMGTRKSFHHHHHNHPVPSKKSASRSSSGSSRSSTTRSSIGSRKSLSASSLAIVKASYNPQKDFKESMLEMITENKLCGSKDLEELLACYLSLNSDEYHGLIINVFKQIWFDFTDAKLK